MSECQNFGMWVELPRKREKETRDRWTKLLINETTHKEKIEKMAQRSSDLEPFWTHSTL